VKKKYYKRTRRKRVTWLSVVTWCAVASTVLLVLSVIPLVSPALFMVVVERLPRAWQDALFMDFLLRGGSGFWEFLVLTFVLWALRSYLAER
jgi:hypothetical protein